MTDENLRRLSAAYSLAAQAHAGQRRKGRGDVPYINHPCAVAALVAEAGGSADAVIAAVLHDTVEDTGTTLEDIRCRFGDRVAGLVDALTDAEAWEDLPTAERKAKQAEHIADAPPAARLLKLADQTANLRDRAATPDEWTPEKHEAYLAGARRIAAACRGIAPALDRAFEAAAQALEGAVRRDLAS